MCYFSSSNTEEYPRCYLTLTQLPHYSNLAITVALSYELVSPYPKFDPEVSLYLTDSDTPTVLLNTGNLLHQIQFKVQFNQNSQLNPSQLKQNKSNVLKTDLNADSNHPELNYFYKNLIPTCDIKERRFFKRTKQTQTTEALSAVLLPPTKEKPDIYDLLNEDDGKVDKNYKLYRTRSIFFTLFAVKYY